MQKTFDAIDTHFRWTKDDGNGVWYEWDFKEAAKAAKKARDKEMKDLRDQGIKVTPFSLGIQNMSRGGIGSGKPHIEFQARVYGFTAVA